jgi:hypothetical protein
MRHFRDARQAQGASLQRLPQSSASTPPTCRASSVASEPSARSRYIGWPECSASVNSLDTWSHTYPLRRVVMGPPTVEEVTRWPVVDYVPTARWRSLPGRDTS